MSEVALQQTRLQAAMVPLRIFLKAFPNLESLASSLDKIDVGVYIVTTKRFQKLMKRDYKKNWEGSLSYEKVVRYLPHFKSAI